MWNKQVLLLLLQKYLVVHSYDDEKDDSNFYKGASLAKKLKLREREIELDNRDRMREKDEIDELKRKLIKGKLDDISKGKVRTDYRMLYPR